MKNKLVFFVIAVLLLIALVVGIPAYITTSNNYVAKVDKEKITKSEFQMYMLMFREQMEYGQSFTDENARKSFWESQVSGGQSMESITKDNILQYLREQKISLIKAKEEGITLTAEEKDYVKYQIDSIVENVFSGKRIEADKYYKEAYGVTLAQYKKYIENDLLSQKYKSYLSDNLKPSDAEISKVFEENKSQYDKITVRHILFLTQDAAGQPLSDELKQEAKNKAEETLAKINAGEDMKELAIAKSEDPSVTENEGQFVFDKFGMYDKEGNYTEFTIYSSLDEDFLNWSLNAAKGETGIVESQYGYHVMKVEDREPAVYENIKTKISSQILEEKLDEEIENWKKDDRYNIKIKEEVYNQMKIV